MNLRPRPTASTLYGFRWAQTRHAVAGTVLQVPTLQVPTEGELAHLHASLIFQKQPEVSLHTSLYLRLHLGPLKSRQSTYRWSSITSACRSPPPSDLCCQLSSQHFEPHYLVYLPPSIPYLDPYGSKATGSEKGRDANPDSCASLSQGLHLRGPRPPLRWGMSNVRQKCRAPSSKIIEIFKKVKQTFS